VGSVGTTPLIMVIGLPGLVVALSLPLGLPGKCDGVPATNTDRVVANDKRYRSESVRVRNRKPLQRQALQGLSRLENAERNRSPLRRTTAMGHVDYEGAIRPSTHGLKGLVNRVILVVA